MRFYCGDLILHQKGIGFLMLWTFFESWLYVSSQKQCSVDKTTETQGTYGYCFLWEFPV